MRTYNDYVISRGIDEQKQGTTTLESCLADASYKISLGQRQLIVIGTRAFSSPAPKIFDDILLSIRQLRSVMSVKNFAFK